MHRARVHRDAMFIIVAIGVCVCVCGIGGNPPMTDGESTPRVVTSHPRTCENRIRSEKVFSFFLSLSLYKYTRVADTALWSLSSVPSTTLS